MSGFLLTVAHGLKDVVKAVLSLNAPCRKIVKAIGMGLLRGDIGDRREWQ